MKTININETDQALSGIRFGIYSNIFGDVIELCEDLKNAELMLDKYQNDDLYYFGNEGVEGAFEIIKVNLI